jgi:hypothetical protein
MRLQDFVLDRGTGVRHAPAAGTPAGYLDGAEAYLLDVLTGARDRGTGSPELDALVRDWPSEYHLTPLRATLLDAFGFASGDARVLELGAGCGAVTRWLGEHCAHVDAIEGDVARARVARARCADLDRVEVFVANFSELEPDPVYDLVTLIGVLEYGHLYHPRHREDPAAAAAANLSLARSALAEDGLLLLAIENPLGLKYLGGAREDHTGRPWDSVNGYPSAGTPVTWSRRVLEQLVLDAGFDAVELFLPFPDYKLPASIVNTALMAPEHAVHNWIPTPAPDRGAARATPGFVETLAQREVARAGMLADLSNSFLVLATAGDPVRARTRLGADTDWVARHWSGARRPAFAKRVTLRPGAATVEVERPPMLVADPAEPALRAADELGLRQRLAPERFRAGDRLVYEVLGHLAGEGFGAAWTEDVRRFMDWLTSAHALPGRPGLLRPDAIDATWWNVIVDPRHGTWHLIDREWELGEALSPELVVWRMLRHFALRHGPELPAPWREPDAVAFADHWLGTLARCPRADLDAFREVDDLLAAVCSPGVALEPPLAADWVLTIADEVDGPLLRTWAEVVDPRDALTLAVYAPGWTEGEVAERIERAADEAGVELTHYDIVALAVPPGPESDAAVVREARAVLSRACPEGLAGLPCVTPDDPVAVRTLVRSPA